MAMVDKIIDSSIALLVFAGLGGSVFVGLTTLLSNTSDATSKVAIALTGTLFALGIALAMYYGMVKKKY
jgi:hypothetical protein